MDLFLVHRTKLIAKMTVVEILGRRNHIATCIDLRKGRYKNSRTNRLDLRRANFK